MQHRTRSARFVAAAALAVVAATPFLGTASSDAAAGKALTVDLASSRGPSTLVGEGLLYGINQDATQPADQFLRPLRINAFRGGGWFSGGWIKDNYQFGSATRADITSITAQARRLNDVGDHPQYQVLLSDLYGLNAGQPSNTRYPCDNGDCSNWATFVSSTVTALQATGLPFAYDIDNEPDISVFWKAGVNSTQYFQMWDTAYREIRRVARTVPIVGPSFAYTPQARPAQWSTFLNHVRSAGTVPDWISNHDEGDVDDPVTVSQALKSQLSAAGIPAKPLSANEYQPADRQTAGVTAWYLARFAQSGYANAMRGNWVCCMIPNLTGILTQTNGSWTTSGNWWAMRTYADMTGTLVNTSGQVGSTAISAAVDSTARRAVAVIGDSNGYTGDVSVTFNGASSVPWLAGNGSVKVVVDRIPEQAQLASPQVVFSQTVNVSGGAVSVPLTFQSSHDAFAVYLTPTTTTTTPVTTPPVTTSPVTTSPVTTPPVTTSPVTTPPVTTSPVTTSSTPASGGCSVTISNNAWSGGFVSTVKVTAGASPVSGWSVPITLPSGSAITGSWNAQSSGTSGTVRFTNVSYNGQLSAGGSTEFGFQGTGTPPTSAGTCSAG
jgi:Cellulose binding domain